MIALKALVGFALAIGTLAVTSQGRQVASEASALGPMLADRRASFDGRRLLLAGWDAPTASLWNVETGLRIQEFVGHTEGVRSVALSPDGRYALTGAGSTATVRPPTDNSVRLWDVNSGEELRRFDGMTYPAWISPVVEVGFSEDGKDVFGRGAGRGLTVWSSETTELLFQEPASSTAPVHSSLRRRLVVTAAPGDRARTWDYRSGDMLAEIGVGGRITSVRWSPDGSMVVLASGREISIWTSATGRLVRTYVGHTELVLDAMFNADGQRVVSASADGSARLWDRESGKLLARLTHEGSVRRALVSPDGLRILTEWSPRVAPADRPGPYYSLWDVESGRELTRFDGTEEPLGFSPDGRTIPVVYGPSFATMCCRFDSLLDAATGQPIRRFQR